ncbi:sugar kinase [Enterovibrio nigricans]|uniref:2-dehydro-3-deoxygluconokinase n=1 Tax=Enterovibrio nigricans DSM 22720 TaxID=1121868 RepID=A0A1T4V7C2_9GAMM|nr:sugar kinase [Enterovibrio nigricans]PKF50271.1 sugar kinase [Enterovibrio nigricans]SKA60878.1 2-dehydro-3-deoxygluconokinase [Enterovibrio nigricans DSM 22720]
MSTFRIAFLGECMLELHETTERLAKGFGGDSLNSAIYLSRLVRLVGDSAPVNVSYLTAMGNDSQSDFVLDAIEQEGVDTADVLRIDGKLPGIYLIENDASGERRFHYWRNDSAARYWTQSFDDTGLYEHLKQFDMVYLSGISLAIQFPEQRVRLLEALQRYQATGGHIAFDSNYRPRLWKDAGEAVSAYHQMMAATHIALVTFDDERDLFGDQHPIETVERIQALGCDHVIVKCGADECLVAKGSDVQRVPALRVETVVDTTSAGDSFNAGYLFGETQGLAGEQSAQFGHLLASHVIQAKGAVVSEDCMPSAEQIQSLLIPS